MVTLEAGSVERQGRNKLGKGLGKRRLIWKRQREPGKPSPLLQEVKGGETEAWRGERREAGVEQGKLTGRGEEARRGEGLSSVQGRCWEGLGASRLSE